MSHPLPRWPRPLLPPLDWQSLAVAFDAAVTDPDSRVTQRTDGGLHFTAFLEGDPDRHELITLGGMTVGRLLGGKSAADWLPGLNAYFRPEWGLFCNGRDDDRTEYWYLMHVNALIVAISRMTGTPWLGRRLRTSLERIRDLGRRVDYDFDAQGFDFRRQRPFADRDAFRQPDSIGGYGYLMLAGWELFGEAAFYREALIALDRYQAFAANPWYEVSNGAMAALAAARMAATGEDLDVDDFLRRILDPVDGPLFTGNWGQAAIDGLMRGWRGFSREEASATAYSLESLLPPAYVLPMVRYWPQLAETVAAYVLNVASNARWFFGGHLGAGAESRPDLSDAVPYETLHRCHQGIVPYASGDFFGHKSVYGGAVIAWLSRLLRPTSDPYVLAMDVGASDFLAPAASTRLIYNPWPEARRVGWEALGDRVECYDLIAHTMMETGDGSAVEIAGGGVRLLSLLPRAGRTDLTVDGDRGFLIHAGTVIDYHYPHPRPPR